jgi:hypothetical protein
MMHRSLARPWLPVATAGALMAVGNWVFHRQADAQLTRAYRIPSGAMDPTLSVGDFVHIDDYCLIHPAAYPPRGGIWYSDRWKSRT